MVNFFWLLLYRATQSDSLIKLTQGFIHFQKIFDTFASLILNCIAKSGFIKPSFSFIKTRNKWFLYPKCSTMRLRLGLITWSNHINNFDPATPVRNCKSLSLLFSIEKIFSLCFNYLICAFFSLTRFFHKYVFLSFCMESVCLLTSSVWVSLSATVSSSICLTQSGTECSSSTFTWSALSFFLEVSFYSFFFVLVSSTFLRSFILINTFSLLQGTSHWDKKQILYT